VTDDKKRKYFNIFVTCSLILFGIYLVFITLSVWLGEAK